jgi:uncharacterized metal-binding protein
LIQIKDSTDARALQLFYPKYEGSAMAVTNVELPLVYACSGCSSAAQMANHVALQLDRRGVAQMSCIAGVGGDVAPLLRLAASGRRIVAIDGCALACVRHCLARHDIVAERHVLLQEMGVKKQYHADFDPEQAERVVRHLMSELQELAA